MPTGSDGWGGGLGWEWLQLESFCSVAAAAAGAGGRRGGAVSESTQYSAKEHLQHLQLLQLLQLLHLLQQQQIRVEGRGKLVMCSKQMHRMHCIKCIDTGSRRTGWSVSLRKGASSINLPRIGGGSGRRRPERPVRWGDH
ncbi:hypothetical protein CLOM_g19489 [Closterium sp. NIES-68]|nr:hypothetical protein CLOM_g19489 [Closterium sp. NIES-68]GJP58856.1 hypothetical protein CLOP_g5138 [Closterium sp. NIES-67]